MAPPSFPLSKFVVLLHSSAERLAATFVFAARPTCNLLNCRLFQTRRETIENHIACPLVGCLGFGQCPPKCQDTWGHMFKLEARPRSARVERHPPTPHFLFQGVDSKLTADSEPPAGKKSGGTPHVKQLVSWPLAVLIALLLLLSLLRQLAVRIPPTSAY